MQYAITRNNQLSATLNCRIAVGCDTENHNHKEQDYIAAN